MSEGHKDHAPTTTASLRCIDLDRLRAGNADEIRDLREACEDQGFFYLDLSCDDQLLRNWRDVLGVMAYYFGLDLEEKMKDNRQSDTHGYEPVASSTGVLDNLPDYYESLKASRDELLASSRSLAPVVKMNRSLFLSFSEKAHQILIIILRSLDVNLHLDDQSRLEHLHREGKSSLTTLTMFRYPKQESVEVGSGHNKHTDLGSLTFLLCEQWGLQVLSNSSAGWQFVAPKPDHAIINIGDSLRFLTNNRLRSAVHRVVPVHQLQHEDRFSIAYFLRAEDDVEFRATGGRTVSAKSWHDEKFDVFRQSHDKQAQDSILTGGMERNDSLITQNVCLDYRHCSKQ